MGSFLIVSGIYLIKNELTGQRYVGQSIDLDKRKERHFSMLRNDKHPNGHLQNSFNAYGEKVFSFDLLELSEDTNLTQLEQEWCHYFKRFGIEMFNYGEFVDNPFKGRKHSINTKQLISTNLKEQGIKPPSRKGVGYGYCKLYCPKRHYKTSQSLIHGSNSCKECQRIKSHNWRLVH